MSDRRYWERCPSVRIGLTRRGTWTVNASVQSPYARRVWRGILEPGLAYVVAEAIEWTRQPEDDA